MALKSKCYSGQITSCFAGHVGLEVKIGDGEVRQFVLSAACNPNFLGSNDTTAAFAALRQGLTASVFIDGDPKTAPIDTLSPNYR